MRGSRIGDMGAVVKVSLAAIGLAAGVGFATAAAAQPLEYTLNGGIFGDDSATFYIDSQPTPTQYTVSGFNVDDVPVLYEGSVTDYNLGFGGPSFPFFEYARAGLADFATGSEPLFTGSPAHPTLLTGDFILTDVTTGTPLNVLVSAAPEPSVWTFLLTGVAAIGAALRRRRGLTRPLASAAA